MTWRGIVGAALGYLLCLGAAVLITCDIILARRGARTISDWCLEAGQQHPWLPALLGLAVGLVLGTLIGHLWFPQRP
jgi:drug/metabolite transporter (DMT)-like permease